MPLQEFRYARDCNRSLPAPVRWAHMAAAIIRPPFRAVHAWATAPQRITWAPYLLIGAVLVVILFPYDDAISRAVRSLPIRGDLRRELEAAQQYGQTLSMILVALAIWLQDPARRRRLADGLAAVFVAALILTAAKVLIGRPRPLLDEPGMFLGPFGAYPLGPELGIRYAWEFWGGSSSQLWSMPSSHTAFMGIMALFLATLYPRLRYLVFGVLALVAFARVHTGAHYLTDVIAGAAIGLAIAHTALCRQWGRMFARPGLRSALSDEDFACAPRRPGLEQRSGDERPPGDEHRAPRPATAEPTTHNGSLEPAAPPAPAAPAASTASAATPASTAAGAAPATRNPVPPEHTQRDGPSHRGDG